jgi:broad specificity phosphatase PhoE
MSQPGQEVYVIRHGETEWSLNGRHTGLTDLPLTAHGRKTAEWLRPVLAKQHFALVLTSPLQRARQTCELAGLGDQAQVTSDLEEWHYGDYEGLTTAQIQEQVPGWMIFSDGCPGGESPEDVRLRVDRVVEAARAATGPVVFFAHGHLLRVVAARWLNLPVKAGGHFLLDTGTMNILSDYRGYPAVKRWNAQIWETPSGREGGR